ncbi:MAG: hypothetical protein H6922_03185 [Pseudomonadaceae bacterium]|nr:hypothetical protein [Pseudomonadaceae bacterium]
MKFIEANGKLERYFEDEFPAARLKVLLTWAENDDELADELVAEVGAALLQNATPEQREKLLKDIPQELLFARNSHDENEANHAKMEIHRHVGGASIDTLEKLVAEARISPLLPSTIERLESLPAKRNGLAKWLEEAVRPRKAIVAATPAHLMKKEPLLPAHVGTALKRPGSAQVPQASAKETLDLPKIPAIEMDRIARTSAAVRQRNLENILDFPKEYVFDLYFCVAMSLLTQPDKPLREIQSYFSIRSQQGMVYHAREMLLRASGRYKNEVLRPEIAKDIIAVVEALRRQGTAFPDNWQGAMVEGNRKRLDLKNKDAANLRTNLLELSQSPRPER